MSPNKNVILLFIFMNVLFLFSHDMFSEESAPTVIFYTAYIIEAHTDGDSIVFPIMPGETSMITLDQFSETAHGYIDKLRSIYTYKQFSLLNSIGGFFSVDLFDQDGHTESAFIFGPDKHIFYLTIDCQSQPQNGMLSLNIETQLDTITQPDQQFPSLNLIQFFKTQCHVKSGHPLVFGRPLETHKKNEHALFVVFTPFFHSLSTINQYDEIVADIKRVIQSTTGRNDFEGERLFNLINEYFRTRFHKKNITKYTDIILKTQNPPLKSSSIPYPGREDLPVYIPFDKPPKPANGYQEITKNLVYPKEAQLYGIEGRILIWVKIDEKGKVVLTRIAQSFGDKDCDRAAMVAIAAVEWRPAFYENKPVAVWAMVPVEFRLHQ